MREGERIDRYTLEEEIGRGSMGIVWAAHDGSERVALKVLNPRSPESHPSLFSSIRAWMRLEHPHLVETLGYGSSGDRVWVAMKLLHGPTLRQVLRAPGVPRERWRDALRWTTQLAAALRHLHARGIVHRDIKPSNLILTQDQRDIKLIDFGLAGPISAPQGDAAGTLGYMAPEVLMDGWRVDARADLYALGCVLFELLSGQRAVIASDPAAVLALVEHGPSVRLEALRGDLPQPVTELVMSLLSPRPEARPGYADEVIEVLSPWVDVPVEMCSETPHLLTPTRVTRPDTEEVLHQALEHFAQRLGGVYVVQGSAGMGKTRLLRDILSDANVRWVSGAQDVVILRASATRAGQGTPFELLREPLRRMEEHLGDEHRWSPVGGSRAARLQEVHTRFRRFVERHPTVLVLDNLHWADDVSLSWLRTLLPSPGNLTPVSRGLLVVGTARHEDAPSRFKALAAAPQVRSLSLEPMGREDLSAFLGSMLGMVGAQVIPDGLLDAIVSRALGSPFHASELLRAMVRQGALRRVDGRWVLHDSYPWEDLLDELVRARVSSLEPGAQDLVETLGLFERGISMAMAERFGAPHFIDALVERGLLTLSERGMLTFAHDRLREAIASGLSDSEFQRRNAQIVDVLEENEDGFIGELAHHRQGAGDFGGAVEAFLHAARDPDVRNAQPRRALSYYDKISRLDEVHDILSQPLRARVQVEHIRLMLRVGDKRNALEVARSIRARVHDSALGAELDECIARSAVLTGEVVLAQDALERAMGLWEDLQTDPSCQELGGRLFWALGYLRREQGRYEASREALYEALALARRCEDHHTQALAHRTFGQLGYDRRLYEEARLSLSRSLTLLRRVGDRNTTVEVLVDLASVALRGRDRDEAALYAESANAQHRALTGGEPHPRALSVLAVLARQDGDLNRAIEINRQACVLFEAEHNLRSLAQTHSNLGVALNQRGELLEAISVQSVAIEFARQLRRPQLLNYALLNHGSSLMRLGRQSQAIRATQEARRMFSDIGDAMGVGLTLGNMGIMHALRGELEHADDLFTQANDVLMERGRWDMVAVYTAHLGWMRCEQGRMEEAQRYFEASLGSSTNIMDRFIYLRPLLFYSHFLRLVGRPTHARAILAEARAHASEIDASYELARIDCEFACLDHEAGEFARAQILLDRAQRLAELIECEDESWLGRGVLKTVELLSQ